MNAAAQAKLEALLDREIELAHALAAHLHRERAALTGNSPEIVTQMATDKVRLLTQFERLETERRALSAAASQSHSPTTNVHSISQRWRSLMDLMTKCRAANETNGLIVSLRQGQIRQLIGILRGSPSGTYGPQGQTFAHAARALARA